MTSEDPAPSDPPASAEPAPPPSRRPRRVLQAVAGLLLGLGIAEAAFRARDGDAFPLINVYERDPERGVRLRPGSETRVGRRGERITHVRVNGEGYRGPAWPPPARDEVLVIGDSMAFGLGVEEDEALAARLHAALPDHPPVIDASVPTHGPPEYRITLEQVLARRSPGTVVIVVNVINDVHELNRPNTGRHTALDGWAARASGADAPPSSPLRELVIQRSHAAFALWRWWRERAPAAPPEDGIAAAVQAAAAMDRAKIERSDRDRQEREAEVAAAKAEIAAANQVIVRLGSRYAKAAFASAAALDWHADLRHEPHPESVLFYLNYGGCIPPPLPYRRHRGYGLDRRAVELALAQIAAVRAMPRDEARAVEEAFARRDAAEDRLHALRPAPTGLGLVGIGAWEDVADPPPSPRPLPPPPHPMGLFVRDMTELAAAHGARLVVAPIPLDAQIANDARLRRGLTGAEVAALDALVADLAASARDAGAIGVDPTPALKRLGAGAYLPDGHLGAAGHEAVARAIGEVLR